MLKHFYENIGENWFSYAEFYKDIVNKLPEKSTIVEVGCWKGRSTVCLGVEIINSGKDIELYCVDPWIYTPDTEQPCSSQDEFNDIYKEFLNNIQPIARVMKIIKNKSVDAVRLFQDKTVDFCFIDASHHYENVKSDISAWLPKIKHGGIIAGHDYFTSVHPGVKQAVNETFYNDIIQLFPEQNVWAYYK